MSGEPSDDSELVHRGSIRELLLEVPLVVAGYLGKAATITAVFVNNLARLLKKSANAGAEGRRNQF